jgi:xylulokinase
MPIDVPVAGDFGGALGAARLGMMAAGAEQDIVTRPDVAQTIEPSRQLESAFADAHQRYREAYQSIRNLT